jgi:sRNA-binding regulator protein Hfq
MDHKEQGESVVPLAAVRQKLQAKIDDPLGLAKGGAEMLARLVGSHAILHFRSGAVMTAKIAATSKFEVYAVADDGKALVILKHAIDFIEVQRQ